MRLANNFNGGQDGDTLTTANTGQAGDNAFDTVTGPTDDAVLQFASVDANNLNRPSAEYVMAMSTGESIAGNGVLWFGYGDYREIWARSYVYFTALEVNPTNLHLYTVCDATGANGASMFIRTASEPFVVSTYNHNTMDFTDGTIAVDVGAWIRIEFHAVMGTSRGGPNAGSGELNYYDNAHLDTDHVTDRVIVTKADFGTLTANTFALGQVVVDNQQNSPTTYLSTWEVNDYGFPGPVAFRLGTGIPMGNLSTPIAVHSDVS